MVRFEAAPVWHTSDEGGQDGACSCPALDE